MMNLERIVVGIQGLEFLNCISKFFSYAKRETGNNNTNH